MFDDVFAPIARDGSSLQEIQIRLQKAFLALVATDRTMFGDAARRHSARALKWAQVDLALDVDGLEHRKRSDRTDEERTRKDFAAGEYARASRSAHEGRTPVGSDPIDRAAAGFGFIIMGTRGMGAIGNLVMGSVATKVVHLAKCPVTLVK